MTVFHRSVMFKEHVQGAGPGTGIMARFFLRPSEPKRAVPDALRGGGNWYTKQNVAFYGLLRSIRGGQDRRAGGVPDLITIDYVGGLY